jgi:antitoxin component of MazEF toxin-antitoxin module
MIEKKFFKSGNSWCISLPTSVLKILGVHPENDKIQLVLQDKDILMKIVKKNK